MTDSILTPDEQEAFAHLNAFGAILDGWGLSANRGELISGIHTLQQFVIMHALRRMSPAEFNDWYQTPQEPSIEEQIATEEARRDRMRAKKP